MGIKKYLIVFLAFTTLPLIAQNRGNRAGHLGGGLVPEINIKGTITDLETGNPLEYATISVFDKRDSSLVSGGLTDTKGAFVVSSKPGRLYIVAEYIAYAPLTVDVPFDRDKLRSGNRTIDLGSLQLTQSGIELGEVEIRAEKSETQFSLDKRVFNVGKDLANRGGTAEDILDNVPSVTVDIDGNVSLRGSTNVRMLIDGRPSGLIGVDNAKDFLFVNHGNRQH